MHFHFLTKGDITTSQGHECDLFAMSQDNNANRKKSYRPLHRPILSHMRQTATSNEPFDLSVNISCRTLMNTFVRVSSTEIIVVIHQFYKINFFI